MRLLACFEDFEEKYSGPILVTAPTGNRIGTSLKRMGFQETAPEPYLELARRPAARFPPDRP